MVRAASLPGTLLVAVGVTGAWLRSVFHSKARFEWKPWTVLAACQGSAPAPYGGNTRPTAARSP